MEQVLLARGKEKAGPTGPFNDLGIETADNLQISSRQGGAPLLPTRLRIQRPASNEIILLLEDSEMVKWLLSRMTFTFCYKSETKRPRK